MSTNLPSFNMLSIPGWRIEQKFAPGVLIGNWSEERYKFGKGNYNHSSTHRIDYKDYSGHKPDVTIRRDCAFRDEGLSRDILFTHHQGNRFSSNMVTCYDEFYNGRWKENPVASALRQWDGHRLEWIPEKSDFPLQHAPTNFGLLPSLERKWQKQKDENQNIVDSLSIYTTSYKNLPPRPSEPRCANPTEFSSTVHKYNLTNKDLSLRNVSRAKVPENIEDNLADVSC